MIRTTYFSALANGDIEPSKEAKVLAVVRRDLPDWAEDLVDRHVPTLSPPERLLNPYKTVEEAAEENGEENPRRVAWNSVDFEARFRQYLDRGPVQQVLDAVEQEAAQRAVWLVCWEANEQWCHRRLLRERIQDDAERTFSTDVSLPPKESKYPGHRVDEVACDPGEHELVDGPAPHTKVCAECGYGLGTLVDMLGHDPRHSGGEGR